MRNPSISVQFARAVLRQTVRHGLDPTALLRKNRISPRLLLEDDARLSVERFADLQVSTMLALQDESLGYGTRRTPIGSWSMMCHAVIGSATSARPCIATAGSSSCLNTVLARSRQATARPRLVLQELDVGEHTGPTTVNCSCVTPTGSAIGWCRNSCLCWLST